MLELSFTLVEVGAQAENMLVVVFSYFAHIILDECLHGCMQLDEFFDVFFRFLIAGEDLISLDWVFVILLRRWATVRSGMRVMGILPYCCIFDA